MAPGKFQLTTQNERDLVLKIAAIEKKTIGEVRIHLARRVSKSGVIADAWRAFEKLGMEKTRMRSGTLIHIATEEGTMACIGDIGIHQKVGVAFWERVVAETVLQFSKGAFYEGLEKALTQIGQQLALHFPVKEGDPNPNELSDEISKEE